MDRARFDMDEPSLKILGKRGNKTWFFSSVANYPKYQPDICCVVITWEDTRMPRRAFDIIFMLVF